MVVVAVSGASLFDVSYIPFIGFSHTVFAHIINYPMILNHGTSNCGQNKPRHLHPNAKREWCAIKIFTAIERTKHRENFPVSTTPPPSRMVK